MNRSDYIRKLFASENEFLKQVNQSIINNDLPINITPEEGRLLQLLIKLSNVKKIVEIGTLAGYSTTWMADILPDDGIIYTIEHDLGRQKLAEENFANYKYKNKINLLKGKAKDILQDLEEVFDMIFIDADKPSYNLYLDWAENHIKKGGLIIADDCFLSDSVYLDDLPRNIRESTMKSMRRFNERLSDNSKYHSIMLTEGRGFLIAIKCF